MDGMRKSFDLLRQFEKIEKTHWWWNGRRKLIQLLLPDGNNLKILDIGCGTGETLSFLKSIRPQSKLYGVDPDPIAIGFSKTRNCGIIKKSYAEKLPFKNDYFDVVMFLDVLEHVKNQNKALHEAKRVLRPGGFTIITAPALKLIWSDHDVKQGHYRRYTRSEIRSLTKRVGMKLKFISYFNFLLSLPIIIVRLLSQLQPFRFMVSYNNRVNYDVAKNNPINSFLTKIFLFEIARIKTFNYPIGISIVAVLQKESNV
ncbi:MAG: Methyltransferase type 11 [Candidatus Amesbacteria bacterium GW2011_GWB1_47_19]|nr:MAG: Methyltransferase type 11 [Candidatus Amesbacteria bacterium GW2011_GWA1_44_24]KKU31790.1 MAG: Methyltransferase type 11 [Candidatus Amesbacteria bacterium GW2011_GWC1_46_24]KKU66726.1 MAG: Methyltransferase type 11 [Candidatus Amesbacteria bacterium GW2011_GWB1_47_19]